MSSSSVQELRRRTHTATTVSSNRVATAPNSQLIQSGDPHSAKYRARDPTAATAV